MISSVFLCVPGTVTVLSQMSVLQVFLRFYYCWMSYNFRQTKTYILHDQKIYRIISFFIIEMNVNV